MKNWKLGGLMMKKKINIQRCEICHEQIKKGKECYLNTRILCIRCFNQKKQNNKRLRYKPQVPWIMQRIKELKGEMF